MVAIIVGAQVYALRMIADETGEHYAGLQVISRRCRHVLSLRMQRQLA